MRKTRRSERGTYTSTMCDRCGFVRIFKPTQLIRHGCPACATKLWMDALENMPWMAEVKRTVKKDLRTGQPFITNMGYKRGKATALRMCLGYKVYGPNGRSNAQQALYGCLQRGTIPIGARRQNLLAALAGPSGAILARVKLTQINQASRFRYWP